MSSKIADAELNITANNVRSISDEDEQSSEEKVSLEKCISVTGELMYALEKHDSISEIDILQFYKMPTLKKK